MTNTEKIEALAEALADCGIKSEICEDGANSLILTFKAFDCIKGGTIAVEVCYLADAEDDENAEIVAYPEEEM